MALIKESEKSVKWQEKNRRLLDLECGIRFHFGVVPQTIFTSVATAIVIIHSFIQSLTVLSCSDLTWLWCETVPYRSNRHTVPYGISSHDVFNWVTGNYFKNQRKMLCRPHFWSFWFDSKYRINQIMAIRLDTRGEIPAIAQFPLTGMS